MYERRGKIFRIIEEVDAYLSMAPIGEMVVITIRDAEITIVKTLSGISATYMRGGGYTMIEDVPNVLNFFYRLVQIDDAVFLIQERGRAQGQQVRMWLNDEMRLYRVADLFGGHVNPHGSGYQWIISRRDEVTKMVGILRSALPEDHPVLASFDASLKTET